MEEPFGPNRRLGGTQQGEQDMIGYQIDRRIQQNWSPSIFRPAHRDHVLELALERDLAYQVLIAMVLIRGEGSRIP